MSKPRVGAQLIVFGEQLQTDFAGAVKAVAAAGYDAFEMGTIADAVQLDQVKAARDAAGIACSGCHAGFRQLGDVELVATLVANTKAVGSDFFITSGSWEWKTLDAYHEAAAVLNRVGRQCQDAGLTFCYHNHHWELQPIDGQVPLFALLAATDPALVKLCPDIYWLHVGGQVPAEFIACYRERLPYYHFKDGLGGEEYREFRELGQGNVDLPAALAAALTTNPAWIVTEQDVSALSPGESVRVSREYLRGLGV